MVYFGVFGSAREVLIAIMWAPKAKLARLAFFLLFTSSWAHAADQATEQQEQLPVPQVGGRKAPLGLDLNRLRRCLWE